MRFTALLLASAAIACAVGYATYTKSRDTGPVIRYAKTDTAAPVKYQDRIIPEGAHAGGPW